MLAIFICINGLVTGSQLQINVRSCFLLLVGLQLLPQLLATATTYPVPSLKAHTLLCGVVAPCYQQGATTLRNKLPKSADSGPVP